MAKINEFHQLYIAVLLHLAWLGQFEFLFYIFNERTFPGWRKQKKISHSAEKSPLMKLLMTVIYWAGFVWFCFWRSSRILYYNNKQRWCRRCQFFVGTTYFNVNTCERAGFGLVLNNTRKIYWVAWKARVFSNNLPKRLCHLILICFMSRTFVFPRYLQIK